MSSLFTICLSVCLSLCHRLFLCFSVSYNRRPQSKFQVEISQFMNDIMKKIKNKYSKYTFPSVYYCYNIIIAFNEQIFGRLGKIWHFVLYRQFRKKILRYGLQRFSTFCPKADFGNINRMNYCSKYFISKHYTVPNNLQVQILNSSKYCIIPNI